VKQVKSRAGDTVGLLLFKHLGRDDDVAEQAVFDVNPGLASYGPVLPAGVDVIIPDIAQPEVTRVQRSWD
jgi:phage tail protein X